MVPLCVLALGWGRIQAPGTALQTVIALTPKPRPPDKDWEGERGSEFPALGLLTVLPCFLRKCFPEAQKGQLQVCFGVCIYVRMFACVCMCVHLCLCRGCSRKSLGPGWGPGWHPKPPHSCCEVGTSAGVGSESWLCPCPIGLPSTGLCVANVPFGGSWPLAVSPLAEHAQDPAALTPEVSGAPPGSGLSVVCPENEVLETLPRSQGGWWALVP